MENDKAEFAQGQSTTSQDQSENEKVDDSPDRATESLLVDSASRIIGRPGSQITTDNSDVVLSQNLDRISTERVSGSGMALLRDGFVRITIPENINKVSGAGNVNQPSTRMPVRKDYRNSIIPEEPPEGSIAESDKSFIRMYYGISEDPEHGVSGSGAKTSSTRDNSYHLRPMVTVIDIKSDGKAQMLTRSTATAFKPQRRDVSNGCVRLILKHVTDTRESRVTNFLKTPANQDIIKELGTGTFEHIALNLKRRRFSDIMMPSLKVVGSINSLMLDRRYSVRQLHGLFLGPNKVNSSQRFVVKTNLHVTYFPRNTRKPEWEDGYVMISGPEAIYNGPESMTSRYWWMFAESEIEWLKADTGDQHRAAIVTCYFPSLPIRSTVETQDQETLLPLQKKFEDILNSEEGALKFHNKNIQTTCRLLILDLLRSCMENWWDFFIDIESSPIIPRIERTSLAELLNNSASYGFFSSQIRDMNACFSYLLESLEFDFNLDADKEKFKRWRQFRFEIESLYQSLSNKSDDYLKRSEFTLQSFQAMVNQKQAENSTGLTVIAAIFLPLGLASSLLSMSENASQVGSKWYDWIGLWFVIGLFCVAGYTLWRIICVVKGSQYGRYVRRLLQLSQFMKLWLYFPFLAVIGASFLAGMFGTKQLAVRILKIGVPSTIALSILILMLRLARWSRKMVALMNKMKRQGIGTLN